MGFRGFVATGRKGLGQVISCTFGPNVGKTRRFGGSPNLRRLPLQGVYGIPIGP